MKFEKLIYIGISSVIILIFILIVNLISPIKATVQGTKTVHYVDNISESHKKIIELFNKKYKGEIEIEAINLPFEKFSTNERKELLARYLRSKSDRIDIFSVDQIWVPKFAKWGINYQNYLSKELKNKLLGFASESCYFNSQLVAVPLYIDIAVMYYRDDLLSELPEYKKVKEKLDNSITWEDLVELQKLYKKRDFFLFQADDYEGLICIFAEMLAGQNRPLYENDKLQLETPEAEKALTLLCSLVRNNISPWDVTYLRENECRDYFLNHNSLFLRGWPATIRDAKNPPVTPEKIIKSAPTPHFKGFDPASVYGGWNLMISKNSANIPESIKFIKFILSDECQKIMYEEGGFLPSNMNLYTDKEFTDKHPELKFYLKLLQKGVHRPFLEHYSNISEVLSAYLNKAIKNEMTPKEALKTASDKIKALGIPD